MNRKEFARRIAAVMRENDIRKPISVPKHVFHISDDEGNERDFVVKRTDKNVLFTIDDIEAVMDAILFTIHESIRAGESIVIHGFGSLGVHFRKERRLKHVSTGEDTCVEAHYIPKFNPGNDLKLSARIFELSLSDRDDEEDVESCEDEDIIDDVIDDGEDDVFLDDEADLPGEE